MPTLKIKLPVKLKKTVLALGSQAKNTLCLAKEDIAYISRIHADLSSPVDLADFEKDARYFLKMRPEIIACDLHPEYQSTKFALRLGCGSLKLRAVQHHHAHIAGCMAEHGLKNQSVIGVAFDGTGLGADNRVWGAEFLLCDYRKFRRLAHLKEIPLVGGEQAILEPWRALAAWLDFDKAVDKKQALKKIWQAGINSPLASSMGRLFDAVGCLVLGKNKARFEAELAIALEKLAGKSKLRGPGYEFSFSRSRCEEEIDAAPVFRQIRGDLQAKIPRPEIARRFHQGVAEMIVRRALGFRRKYGVGKIVLSGGVFQNKLLLKITLDLLYKKDFRVFTQGKLPCNDAGISLGQAMIAGLRG